MTKRALVLLAIVSTTAATACGATTAEQGSPETGSLRVKLKSSGGPSGASAGNLRGTVSLVGESSVARSKRVVKPDAGVVFKLEFGSYSVSAKSGSANCLPRKVLLSEEASTKVISLVCSVK